MYAPTLKEISDFNIRNIRQFVDFWSQFTNFNVCRQDTDILIDYTITPAIAQTINANSTTLFTVNPASGYGIASVTGCSGALSGSNFATGVITGNCTIGVTAVARTANSGSTSKPTISDALRVLQAVVNVSPLSAIDKIRYDVAPLHANGTPLGNGIINAADIILILRRSIDIGIW